MGSWQVTVVRPIRCSITRAAANRAATAGINASEVLLLRSTVYIRSPDGVTRGPVTGVESVESVA